MDGVTKRPFEMRAQAAKDEYLRLKNMSEEERVATIKQTVASGENIYDRFFQMNADATNAPATKPLPPKEGGEEGGMGGGMGGVEEGEEEGEGLVGVAGDAEEGGGGGGGEGMVVVDAPSGALEGEEPSPMDA